VTIGVRGKLFITSLVLIVGVIAVGGGYLESQLREQLETRLQAGLDDQAHAAKTLLERSTETSVEAIDSLTDKLAADGPTRFTVIASDGRVLGDSALTAEQVYAVENHGERPEVRQARSEGVGLARRYSTTGKHDMLYLAHAYETPAGSMHVARVALPLSEIEHAVGQLRFIMLVGGLISLLLAIVFSWLASELMSRTLRSMVANARAMAGGDRRERIELDSADEHGRLADSFNRIADELDGAVSTLGAERLRLEVILQRMRDAVLAIDADDKLVMANDAAHKLLKLSEDDIGRPLAEALPIPELPDLIERSRSGSDAMAELTLPKPSSRSVEVRAAELRTVRGSVIVMHDVTEVRRLERVRRDFVANVSHELRTPVSIIRANAETLLSGALGDVERAPKFVDAIHRNAERLTTLITDLLDLSTLESGAMDLALAPVMMDAAVETVLESSAVRAEERNITVTSEVQSNIAARADATALAQILQNLLDNAIKYTPDGGHVEVRVQPDAEDEETVRIEVEDDGPGIEPKHRKRVFERFYRVDPGRSRQLGGTGLGLSIVKHLVESMGGRAGMNPAHERGSIFWVELPREVPPRGGPDDEA
jgi:two-component system phosphate regulon sensor histidine kinase PhoR